MVVVSDSTWLKSEENESLYDTKFYKIIKFYLLHSPCKDRSYTPILLENFGWVNPWHSVRFKELIHKTANFSDDNFFYATKQEDFNIIWSHSGFQNDFYNIHGKEFVVFCHAGESNQYLDLLHHIRNSLAHGRYKLKEFDNKRYLYMEDVAPQDKGFRVTARMILTFHTLIEWIKIFKAENKQAKELIKELSIKKDKKRMNNDT